jgi:D-alanine-D-alanine ligase
VTTSSRKLRVAVVFGGRSTEHSISCVSAGSILRALDRDLFEVVPVGITQDGRWVLAADDPSRLEIRDRALPSVKDGATLMLPSDPGSRELVILDPTSGPASLAEVDVVFPVLHGAYGEDGTVQGLLELAGIPYVGSGVLGSAISMDKEYTKRLLEAVGVPVAPYALVRPGQTLSTEDQDRLGLPVFVKPARAGSSLGITKLESWSDWESALAAARDIDPKVLVDGFVAGREIECAVLEGEDGRPTASLPAEIRLRSGFDWYSFEAKYLDDACDFDVPAQIGAQETAQIREIACKVFTALDCAGLARVDFFLTPEGRPLVNEVNTMPGFTPISLFPRMWEATGLPYRELLTHVITVAHRKGTGLR